MLFNNYKHGSDSVYLNMLSIVSAHGENIIEHNVVPVDEKCSLGHNRLLFKLCEKIALPLTFNDGS